MFYGRATRSKTNNQVHRVACTNCPYIVNSLMLLSERALLLSTHHFNKLAICQQICERQFMLLESDANEWLSTTK